MIDSEDRQPARIYMRDDGLAMTCRAAAIKPFGKFTVEYVRADLYEAALSRIAELEAT